MSLILQIHAVVALTSVVFSFYNLARPTYKKLKASNVLIVFTLLTGVGLVYQTGKLLHVCLVGLCYLACVSYLNYLSYKKIALEAL